MIIQYFISEASVHLSYTCSNTYSLRYETSMGEGRHDFCPYLSIYPCVCMFIQYCSSSCWSTKTSDGQMWTNVYKHGQKQFVTSPLHLNITLGIPTALLEKKKAEIRQRKEEKEKIEQKLKENDIPQDPSISTTTENTEKNQE